MTPPPHLQQSLQQDSATREPVELIHQGFLETPIATRREMIIGCMMSWNVPKRKCCAWHSAFAAMQEEVQYTLAYGARRPCQSLDLAAKRQCQTCFVIAWVDSENDGALRCEHC